MCLLQGQTNKSKTKYIAVSSAAASNYKSHKNFEN